MRLLNMVAEQCNDPWKRGIDVRIESDRNTTMSRLRSKFGGASECELQAKELSDLRKHVEYEYYYAHPEREELSDVKAEYAGRKANLVKDLRKQAAAAEAVAMCNSHAQHQHA